MFGVGGLQRPRPGLGCSATGGAEEKRFWIIVWLPT
jgi:hypothetical protein